MSIIELEAVKKWNKIPKHIQELLVNNVFCPTCGTTRIVDYSLNCDDIGILLKGKCKKCGKNITRVIEDE